MTTREVFINLNSGKTFIIQHPLHEEKYLVHSCLEGPEQGVYYRGVSEIVNDHCVEVNLPNYVDKFSTEFTIHLTQIYNGRQVHLSYSEIENNKFTVYGENTKFSYIVYGKRADINIEPNKNEVQIRGDGPYKYIY